MMSEQPVQPLYRHPEWPGYAADAEGRPCSLRTKTPRLLRTFPLYKDGLPHVELVRDGKSLKVPVEKFVVGCGLADVLDESRPAVPASDEVRLVRAYRAILSMRRRPTDAAAGGCCGLTAFRAAEVRRSMVELGLWPVDLRRWPAETRPTHGSVRHPALPTAPEARIPRIARTMPRGGWSRQSKIR